MANLVLGGLIVGTSWIEKGISVSAQLNESTSVGILLKATSWVEPISLTICFVALLLMDLIINHVNPYIRGWISQRNVEYKKNHTFCKQGSFRIISEKKGIEIYFNGPLDSKTLRQFQSIIESSAFSSSENGNSSSEIIYSSIK
jgi:hypothetical protein